MAKDSRQLGDPGTASFQLEKYPFYLLNRAVSRYNVIIETRLKTIDIDIPTWRVLMILGERSPRGVSEIAEAAVINLSTMMRIVQRMRKAGLVRFAPRAEDNRVTQVFLTLDGEARLDAARRITAPVYADLIAGFSEQDFDGLIDLMNRLFDNLTLMESSGR